MKLDPITEHILIEDRAHVISESISDIINKFIRPNLSGLRAITDKELEQLLTAAETKGVDQGFNAAKDIYDHPFIPDYKSAKDIGGGVKSGMIYGVGATLLVAIFAAIATYVYRNNMSRAAKACRKYTGREKKACMYKYKADALEKKEKALRNNSFAHCAKAKNIGQCRALTKQKIYKIQNQVRQLKTKARNI